MIRNIFVKMHLKSISIAVVVVFSQSSFAIFGPTTWIPLNIPIPAPPNPCKIHQNDLDSAIQDCVNTYGTPHPWPQFDSNGNYQGC